VSLIQEALKRQHSDSDGDENEEEAPVQADDASSRLKLKPTGTPPEDIPEVDTEAPPPSVPDDAPPPAPSGTPPPDLPPDIPESASESDSAAAPTKNRRALPVLLGAAVCGVLLLGGIVWLISAAAQSFQGGGEEPKPTPAKPAATEPVKAPPVESVEPEPAKPAPVVEPAKPVPAKPEPAKPVAKPTQSAMPMLWPILSVKGIISSGPGGGAIINSQIIEVGDSIDGAKVISVVKGNVTLEFEGETKVLRVGDITN
jgi:hypothetical protein